LILDEAQGLPVDVLEEIRMLLNCETLGQGLLQIVLAGQPELEVKLNRSELRHLKQRITFRCRTASLTLQETHDYIQSRLYTAGGKGKQLFASETVEAVHFYSCGIPRVINLLCEHALINAYVDGVHLVPAQMVDEIAHDLQFDDKRRPSSINFRVADGTGTDIQQLINSDSSNEEIALHLTDEPTAIVAHIDAPSSHCAAKPCREDSVQGSAPAVVSSLSIRAWTILDGSKSESGAAQMNVGSGEQLLAELTAARPLTVQTPCIASRKIGMTSELWRASRRTWNRTFDKRALYGFASYAKSQIVCTALRFRPMIRRLGLFLQDAEWRNRCLSPTSIAGTLRVGRSLLRWLREPMRPAQLRAPSRRY
jgi:hypothetical protein